MLELGDDTAAALGIGVERERRLLMVVAVILVALAVAAAGPIAFVALMAGPIAQRLLGSAGSGILAAACVGALLMVVSDLVAQHLLPVPLSTGVVTGLVGAPYLVWLLISTNREWSRRMSALEVRDLTLGYGDVDIVHGLSTTIPSNRITAIIGANASGKSTLLRGMARLLEPRAGEVLLDGRPVARDAQRRGGQGARPAAAVARRARRHHGRRPGGPRPLPAPGLVPALRKALHMRGFLVSR